MMAFECIFISLLNADTAIPGPSGLLQIPDITAKKSAPARTNTPQFSADIPPMATQGTVVWVCHHVMRSGFACTRGCFVVVGKKAPKAM